MKRPDPAAHHKIGANITKMRKAGLSHKQALAVALQWRAKQTHLQDKLECDTVNIRQETNTTN